MLAVFGIVLSASLIGASQLKDKIEEYRSLQTNALACLPIVPAVDTKILGHSEVIHLGEEKGLVYDAKIDSGAHTSSVHAKNIETFVKSVKDTNGTQDVMFVRFDTEDAQGKKMRLEKMVSRIHQVKSASGVSSRYFFMDSIWISSKKYEIEINLADRSHLSKKMLLGKNLINQGYLIDTTKAYVLTEAIVSN
jgi:hypothetical protein